MKRSKIRQLLTVFGTVGLVHIALQKCQTASMGCVENPPIPTIQTATDSLNYLEGVKAGLSGESMELAQSDKTKGLNSNLDTLRLVYHFQGMGPRWVGAEVWERAYLEDTGLTDMDLRGGIEFNTDKHGLYLEAASCDIRLPPGTGVNGTRITVIGREYLHKKMPDDAPMPQSPKGRVFRYYSYVIDLPVRFWGPMMQDSISLAGDTYGQHLTVVSQDGEVRIEEFP